MFSYSNGNDTRLALETLGVPIHWFARNMTWNKRPGR